MKHYRKKLLSLFCAAAFTLSIAINSGAVVTPFWKGPLQTNNFDCDLIIFKGNISCYILLLKSPLTLENTKFIAGELSLKVSLVLYLPIGHYEPR